VTGLTVTPGPGQATEEMGLIVTMKSELLVALLTQALPKPEEEEEGGTYRQPCADESVSGSAECQ